jgi:hypothetical protein
MWDLWWTERHWAGFIQVFRLPLPLIPLIVPQSPPSIIQGWYNRLINGRRNSVIGSPLVPKVNKSIIRGRNL